MVEGADEGQTVRPFLAVRPEHHQAGVVLLGEEFETGRVGERVDRVGPGEFHGEGSFEGI